MITIQGSRLKVLEETHCSIASGARSVPPKGVAPSTVWRWITEGIVLPDGERLKLESCKVGHQIITSKEAIRRFIARCSGETVEAKPIPARRRGSAKQLDQLVGV